MPLEFQGPTPAAESALHIDRAPGERAHGFEVKERKATTEEIAAGDSAALARLSAKREEGAASQKGMAAESNITETSVRLSAEVNAAMRRQKKILALSMAVMCVSVMASMLFFGKISFDPGYKISHFTITMAYIAFLIPLLSVTVTAGFMVRGRLSTMRRKVQRLRAARGSGAAGTLIELLASDDPKLRRSAAAGLIEILPRWTEEDLQATTSAQRAALHAALQNSPLPYTADGALIAESGAVYSDLQRALCDTFVRIGDHSELAALRHAVDFAGNAQGYQPVWIAAKLLEARLASQSQPRSLLRASNVPDATPSELLRPSAGTQTVRPGELLRSGQKPNHVI